MHTFEFVRPADSAAAVATAAQAKTAQQGAEVRFVAGGTTLLDLMKLNVETPARVIDINRLPLDKIEAYVAAFADLIEREPATMLYIDENQVRFWPKLRKEFEPRTLSAMVSGWIGAGRRDGSIDKTVSLPVQTALAMGAVSQWAAMRAAGLASAAKGRKLPRAVRRARCRTGGSSLPG